MKLLTKEIERKLIKNFHNENKEDMVPAVKFFTPDGQCTWMITEYDPESREFFGLCDLGLGCAELGYVSLDELQELRGKLGLPVERDMHFEGTKTLNEYLESNNYGDSWISI